MTRKTSTRSQHFWADEETDFMLIQLKELNVLKCMDGRRTRNGEAFKRVQERMASAGYTRTPEQIRGRWKHVKQAFLKARQNNQTSGHAPVTSSVSDMLEELLGHRPLAQAHEHRVDVGFGPITEITSGTDLVDTTGTDLVDTTMEEDTEPSTPSSSDSLEHERSTTPALQDRTSTPLAKNVFSTVPWRSERRRGHRRVAPEMGEFLDRPEDMQRVCIEAFRESQDREERLVRSMLESNATVVASLLEGMRSFLPPTHPVYIHNILTSTGINTQTNIQKIQKMMVMQLKLSKSCCS